MYGLIIYNFYDDKEEYKKMIGSKKDVINQSTHTAMLVSFEVVYNIYIIQEGDKYHNHKIMKSGYLCDKGNV